MGLSLESPVSFDGSTAYDKATRRDSPHASYFSPFHAFKARRVSRRLSRQQSNTASVTEAIVKSAVDAPCSTLVSAKDSIFFMLPLHLRERIYSLVINPTGSRVLHILLKHHSEPDRRAIRFRACRATPALDIPCSSSRCKAWLDTATGTYRGAFDSIINLLLISKDIECEVSSFLCSAYDFDFDHARAIRTFCSGISPRNSHRLRCASFEPQYWFFRYKFENMMLPEAKWAITWQALGSLQGLKRLTVRYKDVSCALPHNLEVLDPRRFIPPREGLIIDVQAPWIKHSTGSPVDPALSSTLPQSASEEPGDHLRRSPSEKDDLHYEEVRIA